MTGAEGALATLERNRFFYGKVMDVRQWRMEQAYGIEARELLARLGLGVGVLAGLGVALGPNGSLIVGAGVAIDPAGRTIVVPADVLLSVPSQPTDCKGAPDGDPVTDGDVTLELCYHECLTEPVPAIVCGCDTVERCEAGVVEERFSLRIVRGLPMSATPVACPAMFPADPPDGFDRRRAIWETLPADPEGGGDCDCLVLATLRFSPNEPPLLDPFTYRRTVYSNQALLELILCLAARVDECCRDHHQIAPPPRVTRLWPPDRALIASDQAMRDRWLKQQRLEIAFEHTIPETVLQAPDAWLRVWSFVQKGSELVARRITLKRQTGGPPPMLPDIAGQEVARYSFDPAFRKELQTARVLIQLRPGESATPIVVDQSTPPLLLDGEHHGSGLTQAALDDLWTNVSAAQTVDPLWWNALLAGSAPPLPSGDGNPGGALDAAFAFDVVAQPKLLAVWPPSASYLHSQTGSPDEKRWKTVFRKLPHLELTFDGTLDPTSLGTLPIDDWLRLWWLPELGQGSAAKRLALKLGGVQPSPQLTPPAGSMTIRVAIDVPFAELQPTAPNHLVWSLHGDVATVDSDFEGLDHAAADGLWNTDTWSGAVLPGPSSIGASLADGQPGGTASVTFAYADDA